MTTEWGEQTVIVHDVLESYSAICVEALVSLDARGAVRALLLVAIMKLVLGALFAFVPLTSAVSGCNYDNTDYSGEVRARAVAELDCDAEAIQITPIADDHGTHTFVCRGCGCVATYVCDWKDYDSCNRDPTLEPADASCR